MRRFQFRRFWHEFHLLGLMVRRRAQRAVSNHGSMLGLAAILRDALASLGLLRMRSELWKDSQPPVRTIEQARRCTRRVRISCAFFWPSHRLTAAGCDESLSVLTGCDQVFDSLQVLNGDTIRARRA